MESYRTLSYRTSFIIINKQGPVMKFLRDFCAVYDDEKPICNVPVNLLTNSAVFSHLTYIYGPTWCQFCCVSRFQNEIIFLHYFIYIIFTRNYFLSEQFF